MSNRNGGYRHGTRYKLAKKTGEHGKVSIARWLQEFEVGDKVTLVLEPSYHKGMFNPRYHGLGGVIKRRSGICYHVEILDIRKHKTMVVHPIHLSRS